MKYNDDLIEELILPSMRKKIDGMIKGYEFKRLFTELSSANNTAVEIYRQVLKDLKELREEFEDGV